jgi:alpha-L-rhamnosidase
VNYATVTGMVLANNVPTIGSWGFGDDTLTRIAHNTFWSQQSNLFSLPTDCPQRDERLGWLADAHLSAIGATFMFSLNPFYTLFLRSIVAGQTPG